MRTCLFWALMIVFTSIASAQTPQQMDNSLGMKLVLIPSGQFTMGSNPGDLQSDDDEKQNKRVYRLPTEAQWEYACRAGQKGPFGFDSGTGELGQFAWFANNSGDKPIDSQEVWKATKEDLDEYLKVLKENRCRTHPVAQKKPNAWGLYDMHGNVWEWCADWYSDYPKGQATDPSGPQKGTDRVVRGGGFHFQSQDCRSAERHGSFPANRVDDLGFRVVVAID